MNVCILGYPRVEGKIVNGVAKVTQQFTAYFENRGHKVYNYHFFTRQQYEELYDFCLNNNIDIAIWNMSTLNLARKVSLPCPLISVWHNTPFFRILDAKVIRYHISDWAFVNQIIDRLIAFVHKVRNQFVFTYVTYKSEYLVLLSDGFKKGFLPAFLFPIRVIAIPNSIELKEKYKFDTNRKNVLYVGRIRSEKRIDLLLKVWKKVEGNNREWNLIIVGDGPDITRYKSLSQELHLQNVKWEGWSENPEKYYMVSSIFCMTSEYEGFPMTLLEAQSFGCVPVVFDSFASVQDIISNNYNGLIVPPINIDEYAHKLHDLMNNDDKRTIMSENAMNYVYKFEESTIMNRWEKLIDSIVKSKS